MLSHKDRIFTDLYGYQDWGLKVPQGVNRRTSYPEGGPTSLKEMVSENHDYRWEWA